MTTPTRTRRMSKVDTAWLRMDNPYNLMMIIGVWVIRPAITLEAVRTRVQQRLLRYPRFGQKVETDMAGASWVDDPAFDIAHHVVAERLVRRRGQSAQAALQQRVGALAATPLAPGRPLWCFHFVADYDGGSALVARIHHCIADGLALIAVMQSLVDEGQDPPAPAAAPHDLWGGVQDWMAHWVLAPMTQATVRGIEWAGDNTAMAFDAMADPVQAWRKGWDRMVGQPVGASLHVGQVALQLARDASALALMADDSATVLKGQPCGVKQVAWCAPLPLEDVRAVARALGASINDVLLSCVAGALGDYLRAQGHATAGVEIRAMVPVNLRPIEQAHQLGNHFGLAPVVLPLGLDNPVQRLAAVRARMAALKGSLQPLLAFGLLAVAGVVPKAVQDQLLGLFSRKTTAVMTNVPGPRTKLKLCGATLEETLFWVPQTGTVGLGVSILSYGGGVQFGLMADTALCPQPQTVIDRFGPAFDTLRWLALMLPWEE